MSQLKNLKGGWHPHIHCIRGCIMCMSNHFVFECVQMQKQPVGQNKYVKICNFGKNFWYSVHTVLSRYCSLAPGSSRWKLSQWKSAGEKVWKMWNWSFPADLAYKWLLMRPLTGWPSESTNQRPGFQLTYYVSKTLTHDPAPIVKMLEYWLNSFT